MSILEREVQHKFFLRGKSLSFRGKTKDQNQPNLLPLLSNVDTISSSLENTIESQAPRYIRICGCFYKIWGIRARNRSNLIKDGGTTA
jgi:hypothetical protein